MPGPSNKNTKKKGGANNKKGKKNGNRQNNPKPATMTGRLSPAPAPASPESPYGGLDTSVGNADLNVYEDISSAPSSPPRTPPLLWGSRYVDVRYEQKPIPEIDSDHIEELVMKPAFIHDPGNGPRVRDTEAFLSSRFFAQPPALDDPMCAEFAQEEVLQMLMTVLPHETARILWYNKSRSTSRICPACQRLYRLGDVLPDHLDENADEDHPAPPPQQPQSPYLYREQEISGLCTPVCFILACFSFPAAIKSTWGRMADEIDDTAWELLNGQGSGHQSKTGQSLGMIVKMTRLDDLGLAQLCFDSAISHGKSDSEEQRDVEPEAARP
ncbi:hypothetical protein BKA70DRAFT_1265951 [Coprinopsis sp. MPI-PUGE-AT-0042]|nr:hypothetical protein BKA70DRAFT_1265951 [Coprinopsis sp. MPI-PUGE-AT-0042]